jgi:uncharacterized protein YqjF (DUF2071 family)
MSGAHPEERVRTPMLLQRWRDVVFVHWPCDPDRLGALLPDRLSVDTRNGSAWITLTPFAVDGSRPPVVPPIPGLSSFIESNVRTYVIGPDGRDGLWFFTLETNSLSTTVAARTALGIPYRWATMERRRSGPRVTYASRRRMGERPPWSRTTVDTARDLGVADAGLAAWLTGRWRAWTRAGGRLLTVPVEHEPWSIADARLVDHEDTLFVSLGLPAAAGDPIVHSSPGVTARLGWPDLRWRR